MVSNIEKFIKHSILVEEIELINLFNFISGKYETIRVIARCIDGTLIETNDIKGIFSTVARTRNFTGHDLRRDDDFSNEKYQKLVEREMDAMFIIIAKEFFYGIT